MIYELISIGSATKDIILVTDRGKIFKTPADILAPAWLGFELGEKIKTNEICQTIGGVATNISLGLKKIEIKSLPFSTIGEDADGHWLIKKLRAFHIKTDGIVISKDRLTPFSIVLIDKKSGERVIFTQKSSGDLDLQSLFKLKTKYLYVSSLKGKIREQTRVIVKYIKKYKPKLIISPSTSQIRDDILDLKKLLKVAKILILNRNEALEIASKMGEKSENIKYLFKLLRNCGPEIICITDGLKGAWVSSGKQILLHSPIMKVKAADVTGAGDAFAAGFLGFFIKGESLENSLRAGIINSASVVKYIGTTEGLLLKKEISGKLKNIKISVIK